MIKKSVLVYDPHSPFEDKQLWKQINKFTKDLKLTSKDEFIIGGDGAIQQTYTSTGYIYGIDLIVLS